MGAQLSSGTVPEWMHVILGTWGRESFRLANSRPTSSAAKEQFDLALAGGASGTYPDPVSNVSNMINPRTTEPVGCS